MNIEDANFSENSFWQIVELSFSDFQAAVLLLSQKSISFMLEFEEFLAQKLYDLDQKVFAQKLYENISADDFLYVRCFVLSQGKFFYEKVLSQEMPMLSQTFEPLLSLTEKAYFLKTNNEFPTFRTAFSYETGSNKMCWQ